MAAGTPVVSTAVLGSKEVLDGARGAMVVPEDRATFAAAVNKVLTDDEFRLALAANASAHVADHWSNTVMAERLLALYRREARH